MITTALWLAALFVSGVVAGFCAARTYQRHRNPKPEAADSELIDEASYDEGYADGLFSAKAAVYTLTTLNYSFNEGDSMWHPNDRPFPEQWKPEPSL